MRQETIRTAFRDASPEGLAPSRNRTDYLIIDGRASRSYSGTWMITTVATYDGIHLVPSNSMKWVNGLNGILR